MIKNILKTIALTAAIFFSHTQLWADEITTDLSKLPKAAQEFALKAFPNAKIVGFEIDKSLLKPVEYDATLSDGSRIEFDSNGTWTDIESKFTGVPASILPSGIAAYIESNYKGQKIKSVSKESRGWEVELANDLELKFDISGNFIGIDN